MRYALLPAKRKKKKKKEAWLKSYTFWEVLWKTNSSTQIWWAQKNISQDNQSKEAAQINNFISFF